jgi:hypothetical protein
MDALLADDGAVVEVWTKDPSTPAFTDLLNRAIDKPKEQQQEFGVAVTDQMLAFLDRWKDEHRRLKDHAAAPETGEAAHGPD